MLLKMDLKLRVGSQGWKETYWIDRSSATPENFIPQARAFALVRLTILSVDGELQEISISNPALPRHSVIETQAARFAGKFNNENQDVADAAVMVRFSSANGTRKRILWLRGLPDSFINFNGDRSEFTPAARDMLQTFLAACISLGMVVHGKNRVGVPGTDAAILDISPTLNNKRVAIRTPGHGLNGGETVTIRSSKFKFSDIDRKAINGTHLVIPSVDPLAPADWFEINVRPGALQPGDYLGKGKWTLRTVETSPIIKAEAVRFASRSTGRVIVATRGRRSAKRRILPIF